MNTSEKKLLSMQKQKHIIISALGPDRPGIVSKLSEVIMNSNSNISESRMIKLGGDFTMMILASVTEKNINSLIRNLNEITELTIEIHETNLGDDKVERAEASIVLSGTDNEGLVYSLTEKLAEHNINIIEMNTGIVNAPMSGSTLFLLNALVSYDKNQLENLKKELIKLSNELDVDIVIED